MTEKIKRTIEALEANNMKAFYAKTKDEAREITVSLLKEGETVSCGGSVTLYETGAFDLLKSGAYNFLDRSVEGLTREEINEIYRQTFFADTFLTSANAVTEDGELINVDGNANRVAAVMFGPKSVIVIVGANKIVSDVNEGIKRIKTVAAPLNAKRLNMNTPCAKTGECVCVSGNAGSGCGSKDRICCDYVIMAHQRIKDRIKVIICQEDLGY